MVVLSMIFALGIGEYFFRAIGFNFNPTRSATPIFCTGPTLHDGDGILRRPGPASWRGRPLSSLIQGYVGGEMAYPDEQVVEISYDRLGFRNPVDLNDWEVVVTGDSFVESGYLAYEGIFTSLAARRLGIAIKNLGVSGTGPIFQTAYVRKYGKAPSTRHAVHCFYDGNDMMDLTREAQTTNYVLRTGHPMGGGNQSSLFVALCERLRPIQHGVAPTLGPDRVPNAVLVVGARAHAATIGALPPRWDDFSKERQELLVAALAEWKRTAHSFGLQAWVVLIPHRHRVLHRYLRASETNRPLPVWQPNDFGTPMARICADLGIRFIDTQPRLQGEMDAGQIPYNLFGDGHLSAYGSQVVAGVLADALELELRYDK
jgi:hypothetical protein